MCTLLENYADRNLAIVESYLNWLLTEIINFERLVSFDLLA